MVVVVVVVIVVVVLVVVDLQCVCCDALQLNPEPEYEPEYMYQHNSSDATATVAATASSSSGSRKPHNKNIRRKSDSNFCSFACAMTQNNKKTGVGEYTTKAVPFLLQCGEHNTAEAHAPPAIGSRCCLQ